MLEKVPVCIFDNINFYSIHIREINCKYQNVKPNSEYFNTMLWHGAHVQTAFFTLDTITLPLTFCLEDS